MPVYQTARFQIHEGSVDKCLAAVKRFSDILYPELVAPVEFIYYRVVAEKRRGK